jgi:hypothetical protein
MAWLSAHPIFHLAADAFNTETQQDTGRNVVTFRGSQVFVAVGNSVRGAELREWNSSETTSESEVLL